MPALEQREFDTWKQGDDQFKQEIRRYIEVQTQMNLDMEGRVSKVEAKITEVSEGHGRRTTWISGVVSAIVGAVVGALSGGIR